MPEVTVVVPVYNCEAYLETCIESLTRQSHLDIEIILVDDGSLDCSGKICDKYALIDSRITVIHKKNEGVSIARNEGINYAKGKWIVFVDGDDWLEKDAIEVLIKKASETSADICIGDFSVEMETSTRLDSFFKFDKDLQEYSFSNSEKKFLLKNCINVSCYGNSKASTNVGVPWGKIYKLDFLKKHKILFQPGLKRMQDMVFNLHAFYYAQKVVYIKCAVYHYRKQNLSATNKYSPDFDRIADDVICSIETFSQKFDIDYLKDDIRIKEIKLFFEWIKLSIVPADCQYSYFEKIIEIQKKGRFVLKKTKPQIIDMKRLCFSQRIAFCFMKFRCWPLLYSYYYTIGFVHFRKMYKTEQII